MRARFLNDETGAVAVDWVVLTAGIVLFTAVVLSSISNGASNLATAISENLETAADALMGEDTNIFASAVSFFDLGIEAYPDSQSDAWLSARQAVDAMAPEGYEFDPNLTTTRYVDNQTVYPIYVSDDGSTYSIGGEIVLAADYDNSGRSSFYSAFNNYWNQNQ